MGLFSFCLFLLCAAPPAGVSWVPTLVCEFDSTGDTTAWHADYPGNSVWNGESEAYLSSQSFLEGGQLHLRAERRATRVFGITQPYISGMVTTRGRFTQRYGYFEISAKVPSGRGMWPAFWGLPADGSWPPEIDVMEILGHEPSKIHMTSHWGVLPLHLSRATDWEGPDFSASFHRFGIEWSPRQLRWYVDDTLRAKTTEGIPQRPFYWLLNLAVGGTWPGYPDSETVFPAEFQIERMRAWQYPKDSLAAFPAPPAVHFRAPASRQFLSSGKAAGLELVRDSGSDIGQVIWYGNTERLGTSAGGELTRTWTPSGAGTILLQAFAVSEDGIWSEPATHRITVADSSGNLITNGTFTAGADSWNLWSQTGTGAALTTADSEAVIHLNAPGTSAWHVQLSQPLPLFTGQTYSVSFRARASAARTLEVLFQQNREPWTEWWKRDFLRIDTGFIRFGPFSFTPSSDDTGAVFKFNLGADTATVYLSEVTVTVKAPNSGTAITRRALPRPNNTTQSFDPLGRAITAPANHLLLIETDADGARLRSRPKR